MMQVASRTRAEMAPAGVSPLAAVVRVADLGGTFLFAVQGALVGAQAHFDPVGVFAIAFVSALGGGVIRDAVLGLRAAAIRDWRYTAIVIVATTAVWAIYPLALLAVPGWILNTLDAAGLGLFIVAGTDKALDNGVHPLPAAFVGTLGSVGGGVLRDLLLNLVPRVLYSDIYASAALLGATIVVLGRVRHSNARLVALVGGGTCFVVRVAAFTYGWQLPRLVP